MIEHARHVPLRPIRWSEGDATAAIEDIVADALEHFDAERFWPAHPLDEGIRDGHNSLYFGATGVIWGIDYLGRAGATKTRFDFRPVLPRLLEASQAEFAKWKYAAHGSLLLGDIGGGARGHANRPDFRDCRPGLCTGGREHDLAGARVDVGHPRLHDRLLPHGRHDGGTALASAVRGSGRCSGTWEWLTDDQLY